MNVSYPTDDELILLACGELDEPRAAQVRSIIDESAEWSARAKRATLPSQTLHAVAVDHTDTHFNQNLLAKVKQDSQDDKTLITVQSVHKGDTDDDFNKQLKFRLADELSAAAPTTRRIRWRLAGAAIAACLGVAVLLSLLLFNPQRTVAYEISDMKQRIETLRSIHIKGWIYEPAIMENREIEMYAHHPYMVWSNHIGTGVNGYREHNGRQWMRVENDKRLVKMGKVLKPIAMTSTRRYLKGLSKLLVGNTEVGYTKLREEMIDGRTYQIYENIEQRYATSSRRTVVWFDPETGLPVKSASYIRPNTRSEYQRSEYTIVRPNVPPRLGMSTFQPPQGYTVEHKDQQANDIGVAGLVREDGKMMVRVSLNIDNKTILLAWTFQLTVDGQTTHPFLYDPNGKGMSVKLHGRVIPEENWSYDYHLLRVDNVEGIYWRWSLVVPRNQTVNIANRVIK
jgi:hypothetical protein